MIKVTKKDKKRFWDKVEKTKDCWNWKACLINGYGIFKLDRKNVSAHRLAYFLINKKIGDPLDHLCRNPRCVNPKHLEIVTDAENVRRGVLAKLNHQLVAEIRKIYKKGIITQTKLGKIYGVGQDEISRVINNKRWNYELL